MPIYEYICPICSKVEEILQKLTDPAPSYCVHCGKEAEMKKLISHTSFELKGSGWYKDLYSSPKPACENSSKNEGCGNKACKA
jgi:putative FmdB family regulatory protein